MSPEELRRLMPATQQYVYLNAAAASPTAIPVAAAVVEHYREGLQSGDVGFGVWLRRKEQIRTELAAFLGAQAKEVALLGSTSMGMSAVASLLMRQGIREAVTLETEFPSSTIPLLHAGLRLRVVKRRPDGGYRLEDVEAAVGKGTGALVASAVQYASGFRLDLQAAGRLCKDRGLLFVVNGAQGLGQVPIDVGAAGIDLLCGTSHKWMMGGYGLGIFYGRAELLAQAHWPYAGWLSTDDPMQMDPFPGSVREEGEGGWFTATGVSLRQDAQALEGGCSAFGPLFGLGAALAIHKELGQGTIEAHNRHLQQVLRAALRARGFLPNLSDDPTQLAGICVFPVEGDPLAVARALLARAVVITPRGGGRRVSTHAYNTVQDVERFLEALTAEGIRPG
jgi:cysteine desulfurase / selenocysteine lyase